MRLGYKNVTTAISDYMGDMRANVLSTLQSLVNDSLGTINRFINALNALPLVNISAVQQLQFGTMAQLENDAARQARHNELEAYRSEIEQAIAERGALREQMEIDARERQAARLAEIYALRNAGEYELAHTNFVEMGFYGEGMESISRDVSDIASHTGDMVNINEKNLRYWRDIAERDNVNRFTTARVQLNIAGIHNVVNNQTDLDGVVAYITEGLEEALQITAERSCEYV
jgi:hypothetical protein